MIQLDNLRVAFAGREVLAQVTAVFAPGSFTIIVGPNGAGKSTLLKAMAGIVPLAGGAVLYNGQPLHRMARTERARRVAFLPQTRPVPEMTALDLVRHGRYPHMGFSKTLSPRDHSAVDHAVAAADLAPLLGRSLATLSGGERQRAYLAMAIAQETEVLLLDEPSTHLDLHYQLELQHLLARLHTQGKTIIMVAQDLPQAFTFAQHICLMQQGRIVCHQPPPVVQQSGTLEQVFGFSLQPVPAGDGLLYQYSLAPADPPPPEETAY